MRTNPTVNRITEKRHNISEQYNHDTRKLIDYSFFKETAPAGHENLTVGTGDFAKNELKIERSEKIDNAVQNIFSCRKPAYQKLAEGV